MFDPIEFSDKVGLKAKGKSPYWICVTIMGLGLGLWKVAGVYYDKFPTAAAATVWIATGFEMLALVALCLWHFGNIRPGSKLQDEKIGPNRSHQKASRKIK
jgi:hypothetical protein